MVTSCVDHSSWDATVWTASSVSSISDEKEVSHETHTTITISTTRVLKFRGSKAVKDSPASYGVKVMSSMSPTSKYNVDVNIVLLVRKSRRRVEGKTRSNPTRAEALTAADRIRQYEKESNSEGITIMQNDEESKIICFEIGKVDKTGTFKEETCIEDNTGKKCVRSQNKGVWNHV